ncbi:hypothetical protein SAMN04487996_107136 [Dyadobacter soli]|uniref:Lipocalin-like domain-containing protein n=1 Tax=Dyadobacter soli TaxID=659014 RepID=A0A1G7G5X4_9BACT|nr:hypothetical protein [Dyadobacter soli]SDE83520.1 hypothetical protein SAMN04487996_107136 [Dyadobacter soli]
MSKILLYPLITILFFCGCSKDNVAPDLAGAVDDKELAEILPGKWTYSLVGKGSKYWTQTISFQAERPYMGSSVAVNEYETISAPTFTTTSYKINIKNGIMEAETESGAVKIVYRIEKIGRSKIILFERLRPSDPRSELAGKEFTKGR